ncbi:MAG: hypothetical protein K9H48_20870 [Melioribacteraceae bacterium]|nr:hypothetical protein [Melioribacteraceae bacterium]MCF8394303.1 hypothetical protein [Melioribacteraceae bacterium]MCF8419982.1 hypothetical protein [Melioribacteraceae bacterium]
MRIKVFQIILFISAIVISQKISAQSISAISIISTDIVFLRTEVTKSYSRHIPGSKYIQPVITYHKADYYSLKLSVKINENIEVPLDIKLTPSKEIAKIYRLEKNIKLLRQDEFYDYYLEIILNETGWYKLEIGDFSKNENGINTNLVFDESTIYVIK